MYKVCAASAGLIEDLIEDLIEESTDHKPSNRLYIGISSDLKQTSSSIQISNQSYTLIAITI